MARFLLVNPSSPEALGTPLLGLSHVAAAALAQGPEGLEAERFEFRLRLTQAAYRDWLKIPPISDRLLAGLSPEDRGERIDREFRGVDPASWRWERYLGFAAWRCG